MSILLLRYTLESHAIVCFATASHIVGLAAQRNESTAVPAGPTYPAELDAFVDGIMHVHVDADMNEYLEEFEIPDTYPEPVTLNQTIAH
jgi:hypothetical protein